MLFPGYANHRIYSKELINSLNAIRFRDTAVGKLFCDLTIDIVNSFSKYMDEHWVAIKSVFFLCHKSSVRSYLKLAG